MKDGDNIGLERRLVSLRSRILGELRDHLSKTRSTSAHDATEFMDVASDSELDDLAARIAEMDSMTVDEIEDALSMLREGHYGICSNCGKKITKRRLRARPFATLCLRCKQVQERQSRAASVGYLRSYDGDITADIDGSEDEEQTPSVEGFFHDPNFSDVF